MNLTKINILEEEGISFLFHNCQDLIRVIRLKKTDEPDQDQHP
jgi:hypothetical protein